MKNRIGRPLGSGQNLPAVERKRISRDSLAAGGSTRVDLTLDAATSAKLASLIEQWQCRTKKEAVELAITRAYATIHRQP